jgi:methionine-rich copper-binding protein CopC
MKKIVPIVFAMILANNAAAHSPIESSTPGDGAIIAAVPAEVSLDFVNDIRLTRVDMVYQDDTAVQLDLGDQIRFDRRFVLPLQAMGAGSYRIEWRGLGADGHAMRGDFFFVVE